MLSAHVDAWREEAAQFRPIVSETPLVLGKWFRECLES